MAETLNVSVNSVKSAYEQLLAEGYIYAKERKGYFIEPLDQLIVDPDAQKTLGQYKEGKPQLYEYSFSHMSTDMSEFPVDVWTKLLKRVFDNYEYYLSAIPNIKGRLNYVNQLLNSFLINEVSSVIQNKLL